MLPLPGQAIANTFNLSLKMKNIHLGHENKLTSQPYTLNCHIDNQLVSAFTLAHQNDGELLLQPTHAKINHQSVILSKFQKLKSEAGIREPTIRISKSKQENWHWFMNRRYRCWLSDCIHLDICQKDIQLSLYAVRSHKFAKTGVLDSLLSSKAEDQCYLDLQIPQVSQQYDARLGIQTLQSYCSNQPSHTKDGFKFGILSMDQSARILVQQYHSDFPAVGLWCQCEEIDHILVYHKICQYLQETRTENRQKCCFEIYHNKYIYFAKIALNNMPELYLVSWSEVDHKHEKCLEPKLKNSDEISSISMKIDFSKKQTVLEFGRNYLQFTLRANRADNSCQFISNEEMSVRLESMQSLDLLGPHNQQQSLINAKHIQSPAISTTHSHSNSIPHTFAPTFNNAKQQPLQQFPSHPPATDNPSLLKLTIRTQHQEICSLKKQVEYLTDQLYRMKKCMTSPPTKTLAGFHSPADVLHCESTPKTNPKKLTQSDLYISASGHKIKLGESLSTRENRSLEGRDSNSREMANLQFNETQEEISKIRVDEEHWDPWEFLEIVE